MQKKKIIFDKKNIEDRVSREFKFIKDLFSIIPFPVSANKDVKLSNEESEKNVPNMEQKPLLANKMRAKTLTELQSRLEAVKKTTKKMSYKDKLLQKSMKNKLRKQSKQDEKNAKQKLIRAAKSEKVQIPEKIDGNDSEPHTKPVYNSGDKMVFSKIDFANLGKQKEKKVEKDPKKILKSLEKQKEKIQHLEQGGDKEKAMEIRQKTAWKNAITKVQGEKVKDDVVLLKKSVKKIEQRKKSSKKKWENRIAKVNQEKDDKQQKRTDNIQKRKKDKKTHKLKKAAKRGKIIPGF